VFTKIYLCDIIESKKEFLKWNAKNVSQQNQSKVEKRMESKDINAKNVAVTTQWETDEQMRR